MDKKKLKGRIKHYVSMFIPVILLSLGGAAFFFVVKTGGTSGIISTFSNMLFFLAGLIAIFDAFSIIDELLIFAEGKYSERKKAVREPKKEKKETRLSAAWAKLVAFIKKHKKSDEKETSEQIETEKEPGSLHDELNDIPAEFKNIKRETSDKKNKPKNQNIFSKLKIAAFLGFAASLAAWLYFFCTKMLAGATPPETDTYSFGLLTSLYFLFFAVSISIYVKMRSAPEKKVTHRLSADIIRLISTVSLVYAGLIATGSVLAINTFTVIPWIVIAVTVYLAIALVVDFIISLLKGDMLADIDYPLLPSKDASAEGVLDSNDVRARFSLKSLWSIKYALRMLPGIALAIGAVLIISTMFYVVQPGQQAARYRFGTLDKDSIVSSGLHVKLPWPIDKVDYYDVDNITTLRIGYENPTGNDYLWTMSHGGEEYPLLTGNGKELVAVNIKLAYKINDLFAYVNTATDPESVISAAAYESIMRRTINTNLDSFLSVDRATLSESMKAELCEFSKNSELGIDVVDVIIENIHPPVDVADVYQAVITASVDKATLITQAEATRLENINYATYYKEQVINDALKKQSEAVSAATGEMAYYYAALEAYKVNPECFKLTQFINVQAKRIAGTKVYYFSPKTEEFIGDFVIGAQNGNVIVTDDN